MVTETIIPKGYKQTDAGVIPDDWEVKKLGDFVKITSGESPAKFTLCNEGIPYFKVDQLNTGNKYQEETPYYIRNHLAVPKKSLIFPKRGASILLNKIKILCKDSFMDTNLMTLTVSEEIDNEFLYYALLHFGLWRIADITSIPQINNKHINPLQIKFPPTKSEQTTIATVLNDADRLITVLEKLIAKKKTIKQGAMQELLTGKKLLPGFSGKWEVTNLGKVAEFAHGRGLSKSDLIEEGSYKCIHYGQLFTIYKELIQVVTSRTNKNDGYFYSKENDVLMPTSDVTPRGLATASCVKENRVILGGGILIIRLHSGYDGLYLSYFITQNKTSVLKLVKGSTVFHLYANDLAKIEVCFPDFLEQKAIAQVLSDIDAEIEELEQKLDKYKMIKQGMMQELLTGRTRLI